MKNLYIGHVLYFATGEGRTNIFASGSIEEITNFAGEFYARGLIIFSFDEIRLALHELAHYECCIDYKGRQDYPALLSAYNIQRHIPLVANANKGGVDSILFSYKSHVNLA